MTGEADTQNNCSSAVSVTVGPETVLSPDLVVEAPTVSGDQLSVGDRFTLSATVRNQGMGDARSSTTLHYYRSSDATISTDDTEVGTDHVFSLDASESSEESMSLSAPDTPGTYYYGACVDPVTGEANTQNNCSSAVSVTVDPETVLSPDLVVEAPTVSGDQLSVGDRFTLSATVRNQGDGDSEFPTRLRFFRSADESISTADEAVGIPQVVSRLSASETSEESISLSAPDTPGTYYYGACVDPVTGEADTQNNCSSAVSVTVDPETVLSPDYVVASISTSDDELNAGERFTINATVNNQGMGDARSSTTLRYYRSSDATISTDDTEVGTDHVFSLDASESSEESISLSAPDTPGTYHYGACVDPVTAESDTQNNCSSAVSVTVRLETVLSPDYVVASISTSDDQLNAGERFTINATVNNQGMGDARSSTTLRYYRSSDATISTDDTEVGTDHVFSLDASESSEESISLSAPDTPGTYYYGACVDPVTGEADTQNNCSSAVSVTVGPETVLSPDLVVEAPTVSGDQLSVGDRFTLSATVRNQGMGDARSSTTLHYYRSSDATISTDDTEVGTDHVFSLDASESSEESMSLSAPDTPGTYYYGACVDPVTGEANTQNNCSSAVSVTVDPETVLSPDLVVEAPTVSGDQLSVGDRFTLSATVRNQGDGDSEFPTRLRFFRSADESISTADEAVGIPQVVSRLSASETSEESISLSAPDTPGTYYYGACVDPVTGEADTQNNCSSAVSVTVDPETVLSPDYVVASISTSDDELNAGERFTINATVNNQGMGDARSSTTLRYYRSSDATISTDDTEVGTDHVFSLDASESSEESISLSAPDTPGTYHYGACVDPVTAESDTQNNCSSAVSVTVRLETVLSPDYVVASISTSDDQLNAGERFTINATVNNQGMGDARSSTTLRYYRSSDATISTDDTEVGTDHVFSLDASESSEESISLSAPDTPGTYYYGACVDPVTGESDTQNNCSSAVSVAVGFTPGAPDAPAMARIRREGQKNTVSWTPAPSASHYNLYNSRIPVEFHASELVSNIKGTSYEQIDTSDLFEYYYWIQACNDLGCSELYWVGPPVRQGIVVIDRDEVSLTIRLFSSGFSTHYALFRSDMADVGFSEVDERIESTEEAVTYIDEGLMDDSTYFYRAKSCNANGCSAFTHVAGGITEAIGPVDVPPPPEGVVAEEVDIPLGPNDGRVRWSATPRATYYEIFEDGQYEATVSAPRTSYYDSSPNTFFGSLIFTGYTVHACNKSGCGPGVSVCISCY